MQLAPQLGFSGGGLGVYVEQPLQPAQAALGANANKAATSMCRTETFMDGLQATLACEVQVRRPRPENSLGARGATLAFDGSVIDERQFHPDTQSLLAYARILADGGSPPSDASPDRLADRLFVLDRREHSLYMRAVGASMALHLGRAIDRGFAALWVEPDQAMIRAFVERIAASAQPGVLKAEMEREDGVVLEAEILLTPLRALGSDIDRQLGMFQPLGPPPAMQSSLRAMRTLAIFPPPPVAPAPPAKQPPPRPRPLMRLVVNNCSDLTSP